MTATITDRLYGESSSVAIKAPVLAVATSDIALSGLSAIGGYTPSEGDRVLVIAQTDATTNGIYDASASAWQRSGDFDGPNDAVQGTVVTVASVAPPIYYFLTTADPVIGTSVLNFSALNVVGTPNYVRTDAEITVGVVPANYSYEPYNLLRYVPASFIPNILNGTSTDDVTEYLQDCIDAACASASSRAPIVQLPSGKINVSVGYKGCSINCANTRDSKTVSRLNGTVIQRDGLIVQGCGQFGTLISGSPGKNTAILDCDGNQGFQLRDVEISGVAGSCGAGVFSSPNTTLVSCTQQRFSRVYITIPNDPTANGGNGTVGFWNYGSEDGTYDSCVFTADIPAIFTAHASSPFEYAGPVNTLLTDHSCGDNQVGAFLFALANGPSLITVDVGELNFHGYMAGTGNAASVGHLVEGGFVGGEVKAIMEEIATAIDVVGSIQSSTYNVELATSAAGNCIRLRDTSAIIGAKIRMYLTQLATKQLIAADVATATTVSTTEMQDVWFHTNLDKTYVFNGNNEFGGSNLAYILPNCKDVHFRGASSYQYDIYEDRHEVQLPKQVVTLTGAATPAVLQVAKVVTPANGIADQNALGLILEFNGAINSGAADGNAWGTRVQAFLPMYTDLITQAITLGAGSGTLLSTVQENGASLTPTSVTMTGAVASNVATASVSMERSGSVSSVVELRGKATLWTDYSSTEAAYLQL